MLGAIHSTPIFPSDAHHPAARSVLHISDTPPPVDIPSQSNTETAPQPQSQPLSQEIPIDPAKATDNAAQSQTEEKQTTEYTWPDSLMDIDMTSGSEPEHTTLLPDKDVREHPEVRRALTSLALG